MRTYQDCAKDAIIILDEKTRIRQLHLITQEIQAREALVDLIDELLGKLGIPPEGLTSSGKLDQVDYTYHRLRNAAAKYLKKSHEPLCKMRNYSDGPARVCTCGRDALAQALGEGNGSDT